MGLSRDEILAELAKRGVSLQQPEFKQETMVVEKPLLSQAEILAELARRGVSPQKTPEPEQEESEKLSLMDIPFSQYPALGKEVARQFFTREQKKPESALGALGQGFTGEVEEYTTGALQALGIAPTALEKMAARRRRGLEQAREEFPVATGLGEFAGGVGVSAPLIAALPASAMRTFGGRLASNATLGGFMGVTPYAREDESRLQRGATGAALGGLLGEAGHQIMRGIGKGAGYLGNLAQGIQDVAPAAEQVLMAGEREGVPVFAADIAQKGGATQQLTSYMEDVPFLGTTGARLAQQEMAKGAAQRLERTLEKELADSAPSLTRDAINMISQDARNPQAGRAKAALESINQIGDPIGVEIDSSLKRQILQRKMVANSLYNRVGSLAEEFGEVPTQNTLNIIGKEIEELASGPASVGTKRAISYLKDTQKKLAEPKNYDDLRKFRSAINNEISDFYKGKNQWIGSDGVQALAKTRSAIEKDMESFAFETSPELRKAWLEADSYYKNKLVPFSSKASAKALRNADADKVYGTFISRNTTSKEAQDFYNLLDNRGQASVRYGMVRDALERATDNVERKFSPALFAQSLEKIEPAYKVFFNGKEGQELDGFVKLMRAIERAGQVQKPETGAMLAKLLIGEKLSTLTAGKALVTVSGAIVLKELLTKPWGRKYLLTSSKLSADSPAFARIVNTLAKKIEKQIPKAAAGTVAVTQEKPS